MLSKINPFRELNAIELAKKQRKEAEILLLQHESQAALSTKMAEYYREAIERLNRYAPA